EPAPPDCDDGDTTIDGALRVQLVAELYTTKLACAAVPTAVAESAALAVRVEVASAAAVEDVTDQVVLALAPEAIARLATPSDPLKPAGSACVSANVDV